MPRRPGPPPPGDVPDSAALAVPPEYRGLRKDRVAVRACRHDARNSRPAWNRTFDGSQAAVYYVEQQSYGRAYPPFGKCQRPMRLPGLVQCSRSPPQRRLALIKALHADQECCLPRPPAGIRAESYGPSYRPCRHPRKLPDCCDAICDRVVPAANIAADEASEPCEGGHHGLEHNLASFARCVSLVSL
jgi:hypothetical protein